VAEPRTVARPYAEAVFRLAEEGGRLAEWSAALAQLAAVAAEPRVARALADPGLAPARAAGLLIGVLAGRLSGEMENFVRVLAENRRLALLPEVRVQFEALRDEREGVLEVEIATAFDLSDSQRAELIAAVERRTGRRVRASVRRDESLIAGVRVRIGDRVIDGSARAQLAALETALRR